MKIWGERKKADVKRASFIKQFFPQTTPVTGWNTNINTETDTHTELNKIGIILIHASMAPPANKIFLFQE
jgi:hypothetical protein